MKSSLLYRINSVLFLLLVIILPATAHVYPADSSQLTQVQVMFEWEEVPAADLYEITVWRIDDESHHQQEVLSIKTRYISCLVTETLAFGNSYEWQIRAFLKKKHVATGPIFHFEILTSHQVLPDYFRTEINFSAKPQNDLLFLDYSAMAIDRTGRAIWFLPVPADSLTGRVIRDLQLTPFGTVTFLDVKGAYEQSLDGKLLWKGPDDGRVSGVTTEGYHHDLLKSPDGSYTVCGIVFAPGETNRPSAIRYNTLIHYNPDGSIAWQWNELRSLQNDSLFRLNANEKRAAHFNGFAFTKNRNRVFMSFKNYSDVYLLDIPSGHFISSLKQSDKTLPVFQQQHGPFFTRQDEILIYNNNIGEDSETEQKRRHHPSIMLFTFDSINRKCRLKWEYEVRAAKYPEGILGKEGYASETAAGGFMVCTGGANYATEITRDKKKIWECYFYKRSRKEEAWQPYSNYRCQTASSLYPLYYTLQYKGMKDGQANYLLHNAGTEPGIYRLEFTNRQNGLLSTQVSRQLPPGDTQLITFGISPKNGTALHCRITPLQVAAEPKNYYFPGKTDVAF